ncbi:glutamate synthase small subunit, partial [Salmonella enterica subsp. enterica serovar Oslo]|nr:glutamate synthase small subunit [Salmonella enterica subsp. enterica serovar Oslo]
TKQIMGCGETSAEPYGSLVGERGGGLGGGDTALVGGRTSVGQGGRHVRGASRRDDETMPGWRRVVKFAREGGVECRWIGRRLG